MGVSSYELGKRTFWTVDFRIRFPDGTEKRIVKRKIPTRELAIAIERKAKTDAFEGKHFDRSSSITVAEIWKRYEPVTKRENRSWQADCGRAKHVCEHLGKLKAMSLTQRHVDQYRAARERECTPRGVVPSVATVNREVALLKRFLNYAVRCNDIRGNPIAHTRLLEEKNVRQVVVKEEEFAEMLLAAEEWFRPILITAYDSGMRRREILDLRWNQVDLKLGQIRLSHKDTKSGRPRTIVLTQRLQDTLTNLPRPLHGGYVFSNPSTNKPYYDIKKAFKRACLGAGLQGIWFHDLRRSFITNARRRGVPESVVMKMSGHRTRNVFDRYNVISEDDLIEAARLIEVGRAKELSEQENSQEISGKDL